MNNSKITIKIDKKKIDKKNLDKEITYDKISIKVWSSSYIIIVAFTQK